MKKILTGALLAAVMLSSCANVNSILRSVKTPQVSLQSFDIESVSLQDITFIFNIAVNNPYPVNLTLDDVGFVVKVEGSQVLSIRTRKGLSIAAGRSMTTPVRVNIKFADIMRFVQNYTQKDYLNCVIDVDVAVPIPPAFQAIGKTFNFKQSVSKQIPALKPSFQVANFKVTAPTMDQIKNSLIAAGKQNLNVNTVYSLFNSLVSGRSTSVVTPTLDLTSIDVPIQVSFDVVIVNDTRAPLQCSGINYEFFVSGTKIVGGNSAAIANEGNRSIMRITSTFSSKALGQGIVNLLQTRRGTYQFKGESSLKLPDAIRVKPLKLSFDQAGDFSVQ